MKHILHIHEHIYMLRTQSSIYMVSAEFIQVQLSDFDNNHTQMTYIIFTR